MIYHIILKLVRVSLCGFLPEKQKANVKMQTNNKIVYAAVAACCLFENGFRLDVVIFWICIYFRANAKTCSSNYQAINKQICMPPILFWNY